MVELFNSERVSTAVELTLSVPSAGEDRLPTWLLGGGASGHTGVYRAKGGWTATVTLPFPDASGDPSDTGGGGGGSEQAPLARKAKKKRRVSIGTCFPTPEAAAEARRVAEAQVVAGTFLALAPSALGVDVDERVTA
jgi:hypothetical protein